jgi:gluconolactonase
MALWMAYDLSEEGVSNRRVLLDMTHMVGKARGLPDGLKVDPQGNLWATGPGGVLIISPEGVHLGTIQTGQPTANCAFTDDFSTLYMTANNQLMRINLK